MPGNADDLAFLSPFSWLVGVRCLWVVGGLNNRGNVRDLTIFEFIYDHLGFKRDYFC